MKYGPGDGKGLAITTLMKNQVVRVLPLSLSSTNLAGTDGWSVRAYSLCHIRTHNFTLYRISPVKFICMKALEGGREDMNSGKEHTEDVSR